jgi:S-layer protein (TIGR01567 family)
MCRYQFCSGRTFGIAITIFAALFLSVNAVAADPNQSGNRVWDQSKNMSNESYTWNSFSFAGFYYDLDNNLSTEELTINNIKRTISQGDISYTTSPIEVSFDYSDFGKYQVIGFMADKYFAGYTSNSTVTGNKEESTIGGGILLKVLLDDSNRRVVSQGSSFTLNEGYVLKVTEIDIGGSPRQAWITLLKDGVQVDSQVVAEGKTYIYSKEVGGISDLPIIIVRFDSVFIGAEINAVFIKGVFQISDSYTKIGSGDRYGLMEITGADKYHITMDNSVSVDLSAGSTVDLMGNLKIIVADDSNVLRFALSAERTGTYEVRGTVFPVTNEWTPLNFGLNIGGGGTSVGFYYDMDKGIGTEDMLAKSTTSDSIPAGNLIYSTSPQDINFSYTDFGSYEVIGFMADKYFAGYNGNSVISGKKEISSIGSGQLQKVLLDDTDRRVLSEGGSLTLKDGYVIKINSVDIGAGPGQVWISLLKDGVEVDNSVVAGGENYLYSTKVGSVNDLPVIAIHFESVFRGAEMNAAFTKGVFQISTSTTSVKSGDRYGLMEISSISSNGIEMDNPGSIGFSRGSTFELMGNIQFKVADSSDLRFYPFVEVTPDIIANQLVIDAPARASAGDVIDIKVTAGGDVVNGASVVIGSGSALTDRNGNLNYTLPRDLKGIYNITATKLGYENAAESIDIAAYVARTLSINAPLKANQFDNISILVTYNGTGMSGANISYDNATIGITGDDGSLKYTLDKAGTHAISASKSGYITVSRDIDVIMPFTEFKALDINITPFVVTTSGNIIVRSNITNSGTKAGTLPVVLIINSSELDNLSVTLAPGETKEINFTHKITLPAGNYSVDILGQTGLLYVTEMKGIPFAGTLPVIGSILFIYFLRTRKVLL